MNRLLSVLPGIVLAAATVASRAEDPPAAAPPQPEPQPEQTREAKPVTNADSRAAERFVPSEEISEDLSVSFPSDI